MINLETDSFSVVHSFFAVVHSVFAFPLISEVYFYFYFIIHQKFFKVHEKSPSCKLIMDVLKSPAYSEEPKNIDFDIDGSCQNVYEYLLEKLKKIYEYHGWESIIFILFVNFF
ncbi:MAG: hypothetical protein LBT82_01180 [Oscillospiraceae bacterium]|nr:hypothetical protein [Oscillospiraceae bacterium]